MTTGSTTTRPDAAAGDGRPPGRAVGELKRDLAARVDGEVRFDAGSRGAYSLAGQCTNGAVVIDWSKYCHRLLSVDASGRTCVVEPGIVLDVLNDQLKGHELRFGPEPATHMNCTIGGMIGNNS